MCGRYTLTVIEGFESFFELDERPELIPRFNIAPTQNVPVVVCQGEDRRALEIMRWGLIPSWVDPKTDSVALINARSETADRKPAFREAFRHRRCLIPATGFFEWKKRGRLKQPYYFQLLDGGPFAFAGLWEQAERNGNLLRSCTILTTTPNTLVERVHDRMPVILLRDRFRAWLGPQREPLRLKELLSPIAAEEMTSHPVSRAVNSPREDSAECIKPIDPEDRKSRFPTLFDR